MASKIFGIDWKILLLIGVVGGYMFYPPFTAFVNNGFASLQQQGLTPVTVTTQSQMANNPNNPYTGAISFTINTLWAYDNSALSVTSGAWRIYHHDLASVALSNATVLAGTGSASTFTQTAGDNGLLYLVHESLTQTTAFIDKDLTVSRNGPYLKGWMLRDIDNNGQMDIVFTLDVSGFAPLAGGQTNQPVVINCYVWKYQTNAITENAISSPTGMTTAGAYHYTGYVGAWTGEGYELRLLKLEVGTANAGGSTIVSNATMGTPFSGQTVQLKQLTFRGSGPTGTVYGQAFAPGAYDASNAKFIFYQANYNGVTDVTQTNYGLPYIYERQAGASWLQWDLWIQTSSGTLTASSLYYIIIVWTYAIPSGSTFTEYILVTLTG